jgi:hypothetical protein
VIHWFSSGIKERSVEFDEIKLQPPERKTVVDFCQKKKWWIPCRDITI